ncbi:MAG TPA: hypothetical protein VF584_26830 [Longimicrobium sp.]
MRQRADPRTVDAALSLLVPSLPDAERDDARAQMRAVLRAARERTGTPLPD